MNNQFNHAVEIYFDLVEQHGEDSLVVSSYFRNELLPIMPKELQDDLWDYAQKLEIVPPHPTCFDDSGNPLYSIKDVAQHLGLTEKQVLSYLEKQGRVHTHYGLN